MSPGTNSRAGTELPGSLAQDARGDLQAPLQRLDDAGSATFLHEAQHRIDDQQRADHREVRVFPEDCGQDHDQLEHPCRHAPELSEEFENRVPLLLGHFVVAVLLPTGIHVGAREPGIGIDVEREERIRN